MSLIRIVGIFEAKVSKPTVLAVLVITSFDLRTLLDKLLLESSLIIEIFFFVK